MNSLNSNLPTLYKRTATGATQEWSIYVQGDKYWTVSGQVGGKLVTSKPTVCEPKNVGRSNETSAEEQALSEAQSKWQKKVDKHYKTSIGDIDEQEYFKVMLAKDYFARPQDKIDWANALVSPKLDGFRFIATKTNSHSRNGKQMGGGDVIRGQLDALFAAEPNLILDGELYNHDFKDDFNSLASLIKKTSDKMTPEQEQEVRDKLQYHVYDVPRIGALGPNAPYIQRMKALEALLSGLSLPIVLVPYKAACSHLEVLQAHLEYISRGYEGSIVRFNRGYENKRTWNLLKVKYFQDAEFTILDIIEGVGNRAGGAGSVLLDSPNGQFNSNIKGGMEFYKEILANKASLIGKTATVQFFELTPDGIPRFPYVVKIDRESVE